MAKKSGNNKSEAELKEEIAQSREELALRLDRVREEVDLPRKIRRSVRREPVPWIVGAIAVGLLLTAVVTRKKKVYVDAKGGTKSKHALLGGIYFGCAPDCRRFAQTRGREFCRKETGKLPFTRPSRAESLLSLRARSRCIRIAARHVPKIDISQVASAVACR